MTTPNPETHKTFSDRSNARKGAKRMIAAGYIAAGFDYEIINLADGRCELRWFVAGREAEAAEPAPVPDPTQIDCVDFGSAEGLAALQPVDQAAALLAVKAIAGPEAVPVAEAVETYLQAGVTIVQLRPAIAEGAATTQVRAALRGRKRQTAPPAERGWDKPAPKGGRKAKSQPAKPEPAPKAPKAERTADGQRRALSGKRAAIAAAAKAGTMPPQPDFTANTHKPYRKRLDALVALAAAGDLDGLRAVQMLPPRSSSPKALLKYRDLCILALAALKAKASA